MALSMDELRKLMDGADLRYFIDPQAAALLLSLRGANGRYQVVASLQEDGRFLQLTSLDYASCPPDHPHRAAVFQALSVINAQRRLAKFAWDPRDGAIRVYADMWLMDGTVSQAQFERFCSNYFSCLDGDHVRIRTVLETGEDPGPEAPDPTPPQGGGEQAGGADPETPTIEKV